MAVAQLATYSFSLTRPISLRLSLSLPPSFYFLFAARSFIHWIQFQFQLALLACARYIFVLPKFYNAVVSLCFSLNSRLSLGSHLLAVLLMKQLTNCCCSQTAAIIVLERQAAKMCNMLYNLFPNKPNDTTYPLAAKVAKWCRDRKIVKTKPSNVILIGLGWRHHRGDGVHVCPHQFHHRHFFFIYLTWSLSLCNTVSEILLVYTFSLHFWVI